MSEERPSREEARDGQVNALHQAIGEFAVAFENVSHQQFRCVEVLLNSVGLRDQHVIQVLLAGYTAEPMRVLLQSLIGELRKMDDAEQSIIKNLISRHQKLISRRNEVMHSTWMIGYSNEYSEDAGTAIGWKLGKNRKGANLKGFKYRAEDFESLTDEANRLASAFFRMYGCYSGGFDVCQNFDVDEDGNAMAPNTFL